MQGDPGLKEWLTGAVLSLAVLAHLQHTADVLFNLNSLPSKL